VTDGRNKLWRVEIYWSIGSLVDLKKRSILTEEELQASKKKLLGYEFS
jgi:hypothetical protein